MVRCANCGEQLEAKSLDAKNDGCPTCGSTKRNLIQVINEEISIIERFWLRLKGPMIRLKRRKRRAVEIKQGHSLFNKTGKWNLLYRLIDYRNDNYHERIVDPDLGTIIHECHEPLTQHVGHGSAKFKKSDDVKKTS